MMELPSGPSNVSGEPAPMPNACFNTESIPTSCSTVDLGQSLQQSLPLYPPQPIYCSDGVIYPGELGQSQPFDTTDPDAALPDNLIEVYNNLGLVGKLLTSGSLATIRFLQFCRNLSENLADALGITRPVYEYEINQYNEMKNEEEQRQREVEAAYASWKPPAPVETAVIAPNSCDPTNLNCSMATVNMDPPQVQLPTPLMSSHCSVQPDMQ